VTFDGQFVNTGGNAGDVSQCLFSTGSSAPSSGQNSPITSSSSPNQLQQSQPGISREDRVLNALEFTNNADREAVMPLVTRIIGAQNLDDSRANLQLVRANPEINNLRQALRNHASDYELKQIMIKFRANASPLNADDSFNKAQSDLKAVLTTRQEAKALSLGLVK
jgi:hypothetical protein